MLQSSTFNGWLARPGLAIAQLLAVGSLEFVARSRRGWKVAAAIVPVTYTEEDERRAHHDDGDVENTEAVAVHQRSDDRGRHAQNGEHAAEDGAYRARGGRD